VRHALVLMAPDLSYRARSLGHSRQVEAATKVPGGRRNDRVRVTMLYSLRFFLLVTG
jgi:hypothetical protein